MIRRSLVLVVALCLVASLAPAREVFKSKNPDLAKNPKVLRVSSDRGVLHNDFPASKCSFRAASAGTTWLGMISLRAAGI